MQKTKAGGMPAQSGDPDGMHREIVADLVSVIEHVRTSLRRIEQAVASEAAEDAVADDVIVLDDVTPGHARADAVLRECEAGLGLALRLLHGPMTWGDTAGDGSLPRTN